MKAHDNKGRKNTTLIGAANETAIYDELLRGFGNAPQCDLDETAFEALDRILCPDANDLIFCEISCLAYVVHILALENGPKELWVIPGNDGSYAFPRGERERYVEEMVERGKEVARAIGEDHPNFKGFANVPPDEPYKMLITVQYEEGVPDALCWAGMSSYFYDQLSEADGSCGAIVYPPLSEQPESQSLREGLLVGKWYSWAAELPSGRVILGVGGGNGECHMVDLSDPKHPWETCASTFAIAACGGCLVPSMCRPLIESMKETTLNELATRISRGTSLSCKSLNPRSYAVAHKGDTIWIPVDSDGDKDTTRSLKASKPKQRLLHDSRYNYSAQEGDLLFVDSSCVNADRFKPLFIDEIPKGQERYVVTPNDGEVLLVSRNEKSCIFYKALCPTLIANSVYIVWLSPNANNRYLECWLDGSFAERWLKTAGKIFVGYKDPEPILSKGALSSLPIPVFEDEIANQAVARKNAILHRIWELYYEIGTLESKEAFAPASAMANPIDEADALRIEKELSEPMFMWQA